MDATREMRIVIGYDGSANSDLALDWAVARAIKDAAPLEVIVAWRPLMSFGSAVPVSLFAPEGDAQEIASRARDRAQRPEDRVSIVVENAAAGQLLVTRSSGAEMLVLGVHGHTSLGDPVLGHVPHHCLLHAACPVVLVRPPSADGD